MTIEEFSLSLSSAEGDELLTALRELSETATPESIRAKTDEADFNWG